MLLRIQKDKRRLVGISEKKLCIQFDCLDVSRFPYFVLAVVPK